MQPDEMYRIACFVGGTCAALFVTYLFLDGFKKLGKGNSDGMTDFCFAGFGLGGWGYVGLYPHANNDGSWMSIGIFFGGLLLAGFIAALCVWIYFLPTYLAVENNHYNTGAICALNVLMGWTFIGWVVALVWSLTKTPPK